MYYKGVACYRGQVYERCHVFMYLTQDLGGKECQFLSYHINSCVFFMPNEHVWDISGMHILAIHTSMAQAPAVFDLLLWYIEKTEKKIKWFFWYVFFAKEHCLQCV